MRKLILSSIVILFSIALLLGCAKQDIDESFRVMTFNIRLNTPNDGPDAWPNRKEFATSMIRFHNADIAGLQEALRDQVDDLAESLPEYGWFGVGRDDGKNAGEFMAVFYCKDRFKVIEQSTFWLSETTETPTMGWDAACFRVVTWGKFEDVKTGKQFYLFNTHFDHKGVIAKKESSKLLVQSVEEIAGDFPVIVTGDFNSIPDSEPHQILIKGLAENPSTKLIDAKYISKYPHHGPNGTITQFKSATLPHNKTIDYIFIKNNVSVLMHGTLSDMFDGHFPSDHMPVLAKVGIE
jgi:endonuclease/exonuclease/phosphatase family metal-dependent hydrolase